MPGYTRRDFLHAVDAVHQTAIQHLADDGFVCEHLMGFAEDGSPTTEFLYARGADRAHTAHLAGSTVRVVSQPLYEVTHAITVGFVLERTCAAIYVGEQDFTVHTAGRSQSARFLAVVGSWPQQVLSEVRITPMPLSRASSAPGDSMAVPGVARAVVALEDWVARTIPWTALDR